MENKDLFISKMLKKEREQPVGTLISRGHSAIRGPWPPPDSLRPSGLRRCHLVPLTATAAKLLRCLTIQYQVDETPPRGDLNVSLSVSSLTQVFSNLSWLTRRCSVRLFVRGSAGKHSPRHLTRSLPESERHRSMCSSWSPTSPLS